MQKITIQQAMQVAQQHLQSGRISEAEAILRQVVAHAPRHAEAVHCLAYVAHHEGNIPQSIELIRKSIELDPNVAIYHQNLGDLLAGESQLDAAEEAYRRAFELDPKLASAVMKLGMAMETRGQFADAATLYRRAISIAPDYAEAHCNLGDALYKLGREDEAVGVYSDAIQLNPELAAAYANRAVALEALGRHEASLADAQHAIALRPDLFEPTCVAGKMLLELDRPAEARSHYRRALELRGDSAKAYVGLGIAELALFRHEDACNAWRMAIHCDPSTIDAYSNLGLALANLGRYEESMQVLERGLKVDPESASLHSNRALGLLVHGDFAQGLADYEYRWKVPGFELDAPPTSIPRWNGEPLTGKTIIVWHEQGLGDTLQFIRYAPLLAAAGATVIAEVQKPLVRLLHSVPGISRLITRADQRPAADFQCTFMDLPHRFNTTLKTIPASVPYIMADADLAGVWHERLKPAPDLLHVGIAWRGQAVHRRDRERSVSLNQFLPLTKASGVRFYSLQKGDGSEQARSAPADFKLIDLAPQMSDFAETAAIVANLDLVISVDTALVHLAGAMGRPVWTLLAYAPDFRWLLDREDSPWYPSMRLFRQSEFNVWAPVFVRVADELRRYAQQKQDDAAT